jgi:hypothetical protein
MPVQLPYGQQLSTGNPFGVDLAGVRLCADDIDWTFGSGSPLTGAAQDLLLVVCGRKLPSGRLHGEPSQRFTRRNHGHGSVT